MSIDVKKLTSGKDMKMSDDAITRAVSTYMLKVVKEQLKWATLTIKEGLKSFEGYISNVPRPEVSTVTKLNEAEESYSSKYFGEADEQVFEINSNDRQLQELVA